MRPFWTGTIGFGLVNIPVKVSSASSAESLGFTMVHAKDQAKIHYKKICARGHEVDKAEIVKAYELDDGSLVTLTDDDFRRASVHKTSSMDVELFVEPDAIDPLYFEKPYYLAPDKTGDAAYALLRDALAASAMGAVVRYVFRNHESVGIILPRGSALILYQLRYQFQLNKDTNTYPKAKAPKRELTIALALIDKMRGDFAPADYHDTYRDDLKRLIAAKVKGQEPEPQEEEPMPTNVLDLMAMLKKSLGQKPRLEQESTRQRPLAKPTRLPKAKTPATAKKTAARRAPAPSKKVAAKRRHA